MLSPEQTAELDALFAGLAGRSGLLLAVSGGPDSMAMMAMAADWRARAFQPTPLFVATVDHGLRAQSRQEALGVEREARKLGLPHAILTWSGEKPKHAIQERARNLRYALLARHADENRCDAIVLAHHADDQAETVLMRFLRGSGPAGLAGMAPESPVPLSRELTQTAKTITLVRPLLTLTKERLEAWRSALQIEAYQDPSNRDLRFRRPQLRAKRGLFESEGFGAASAARLARRARRAETALAQAFLNWRNQLDIEKDAQSWRFSRAAAAQAPEEFLVRLVRSATIELGAGAARLERTESLVGALTDALARGGAFSATLGGLRIFSRAEVLIFERERRRP